MSFPPPPESIKSDDGKGCGHWEEFISTAMRLSSKTATDPVHCSLRSNARLDVPSRGDRAVPFGGAQLVAHGIELHLRLRDARLQRERRRRLASGERFANHLEDTHHLGEHSRVEGVEPLAWR